MSRQRPAAELPTGTIEIDDAHPNAYVGAVLGVLEDYSGADIWRDVISELLTDDERRAADGFAQTDRFEHAGYRFRCNSEGHEWIADERWFATII